MPARNGDLVGSFAPRPKYQASHGTTVVTYGTPAASAASAIHRLRRRRRQDQVDALAVDEVVGDLRRLRGCRLAVALHDLDRVLRSPDVQTLRERLLGERDDVRIRLAETRRRARDRADETDLDR